MSFMYPDERKEVKEGDRVSLKKATGGSPFHVKGAIGYVEFDGGDNLNVRIFSGPDDDFGTPASVSVNDLNFLFRNPE